MGRDCTLRLKATIESKAGKVLADFCRDWSFIKNLSQPPENEFWSTIYEGCQNLFSDFGEEKSIKPLEAGKLDLTFEGKFDDKGVELLEKQLLPKILVELETFHYVLPEFGCRVDYSFDKKKRVLSKRETEVDEAETEEDNREIETTSPTEWRTRLFQFLKFLSDIEKQKKVMVKRTETFDFDPPYTTFNIWFDVHTYYMERLHFEDGLDPLVEEGFLTAIEAKKFSSLDKHFQKFLPKDLLTENTWAILHDKKWIKIAELAQTVLNSKEFVLPNPNE